MQAINKHTFVKKFLASKRNWLKTKENTKKLTKVILVFKIKAILYMIMHPTTEQNRRKNLTKIYQTMFLRTNQANHFQTYFVKRVSESRYLEATNTPVLEFTGESKKTS